MTTRPSSRVRTVIALGIAILSLSSCSDPRLGKLQDDLTKSKQDQARAEGELTQIKADNESTTAGFQSTITAQKAQIESLQQQLKDSSASLAALQAQIANTQIQQINQKKEDLRQQSYGKAIDVLKGIRSRIAVGMNRADYLALIRESNASIASDLELEKIDASRFSFPKDWMTAFEKDLPNSILVALQAYKDVMVLDAASAPDKWILSSGDTQYVLKGELREVINKWDLTVMMKGKIQLHDVPLVDPSIGYVSKKGVETYDISELNTLKQEGALIIFKDEGEDIRQALFVIASKGTDAAAGLYSKDTYPVLENPPSNQK